MLFVFFPDWRCFNDSSVRADLDENAVTPHAYLLFYRRRDLAPDHILKSYMETE